MTTTQQLIGAVLEPLERRVMLSSTIVEFQTVMGNFEVELFDEATPVTVANFLNYVNRGDYDNSVVHRSVPGFVIQGGGFQSPDLTEIPTDDPIVNEPGISNTRGTIAMAKLPGDPDSATSQWFINLDDNSELLDEQNGGFTVFGQVLGDGMDVVDAIAALPTFNAGAPFNEIPLRDFDPDEDEQIEEEHLVVVTQVSETGLEVPGPPPEEPGVNELDVIIGDDAPERAVFTDADGTTATIALRGRGVNADLRFVGDNLVEEVNGREVVITGDNIRLESIDTTGTGFRDRLTIDTDDGGDGRIEIDSIVTDGSLDRIDATNVNLAGDLVVAGRLRDLSLGHLDGANVFVSNFHRSGTTVRLASVVDSSLEFNSFVRRLEADTFVNTNGMDNRLTTPFLRQMRIEENFDARLNLSGVGPRTGNVFGEALGTARIGGQIGPSPWQLGARANELFADSTHPDWQMEIDGEVRRVHIEDDESRDRLDGQIVTV